MTDLKIQSFKIGKKIRYPQRCTLARGGGLSRLKVCVCQCRRVLILVRKCGQRGNAVYQLAADNAHSVAHNNNIGVVADIAGSSPQVDNAAGSRAGVGIGPYVGHDVMTQCRFIRCSLIVVNVLSVRLKLRDLCFCYVKPQLALCLGQRYPQPPPSAELNVS